MIPRPNCRTCARTRMNERKQLLWCQPEDKPVAQCVYLMEHEGFQCRMGWMAKPREPVHTNLAPGQRMLDVS